MCLISSRSIVTGVYYCVFLFLVTFEKLYITSLELVYEVPFRDFENLEKKTSQERRHETERSRSSKPKGRGQIRFEMSPSKDRDKHR